jgi:hypothetical protein
MRFFAPTPPAAPPPAKPVLDLSGPRLKRSFETLLQESEATGGVERLVKALALKAVVFQDRLAAGRDLGVVEVAEACVLVGTARRRIVPWLQADRFPVLRAALAELLEGAGGTAATDARMAAFVARFPMDREHRWTRDLGAEVLHFTNPERYPLMTRWVWDAQANSGVLREIWFGEDVDRRRLEVPDTYEVFLTLREELSQFLADNGVFRDVPFYVDALCAQVYGEYVAAQGGSYLRADFNHEDVPGLYTRRMLGLARPALVAVDEPKRLN